MPSVACRQDETLKLCPRGRVPDPDEQSDAGVCPRPRTDLDPPTGRTPPARPSQSANASLV